ncbi:MAG: hypothetical protein ACX931_01620 [Saccharospirillum sp.]
MMRAVLLLSLMGLLAGCASYHAQRSDVSSQIDLWLADDQYQRALNTLGTMRPSHPDYERLQARVPDIEQQRQTYRQHALGRAESLAQSANWVAAVTLLDEALNNLGPDEALQSQRDAYEAARLRSVTQSENAILLARARFLLESRASEETLLRANPDGFWARQRYRTFNIDVRQTAEALAQRAQRWLEDNNRIAAVEALVMANRLSPQADWRDQLAAIQAEEAQTRIRATERNRDAEANWAELEDALRQALQLNDLTGARQLTLAMARQDPQAAAEHEARVAARIEVDGQVLMERGRLLYSQGFLREALDVWQEALRFKPDDPELRAYAERAETFMRNLDQWGE